MCCPLCEGSLRLRVNEPASLYALGSRYDVYQCIACGLGVTVPLPSAEELARIYAEAYGYDSHALIASEKRWRARRILSVLPAEPFASLLDVGCMHGELLREARELGVQELEGIEPAEGPASRARALGFEISRSKIEEFALGRRERFDIVVAQHVLEHVPDLDSFLAAVLSLLRPGGRLVICVPHFGSWMQRLFRRSWGWYQVPVHVFHFSPGALAAVCERNGFTVEFMRFRGGDSLLILLTLVYAFSGAPTRPSPDVNRLQRAVISLASVILRPFYYIGTDEIVAVMRKGSDGSKGCPAARPRGSSA